MLPSNICQYLARVLGFSIIIPPIATQAFSIYTRIYMQHTYKSLWVCYC